MRIRHVDVPYTCKFGEINFIFVDQQKLGVFKMMNVEMACKHLLQLHMSFASSCLINFAPQLGGSLGIGGESAADLAKVTINV